MYFFSAFESRSVPIHVMAFFITKYNNLKEYLNT